MPSSHNGMQDGEKYGRYYNEVGSDETDSEP